MMGVKGKNEYTVNGDVTVVTDSKGNTFLIDTEDIPRIEKYTWGIYDDRGYVIGFVNGKNVRLHRFIMGIVDDKELMIDHINHKRNDNRKANLRICTSQENNRNKNSKGYYNKCNGRYEVRLVVDRKNLYYGCYDTEEQARAVRIMAEKEHFGEFSSNAHLFNDPEILRLYEEVKYEVKRQGSHNDYIIHNNEVHIKATNTDEVFIIDLEDFEKIKDYTWISDRGMIKGSVNGKVQLLNRVILGITPEAKNLRIRYLDGNKFNFKKDNLQFIKSKRTKKK